MSSLNQDIAYLVPKTLWERTLQLAKESKKQSGGALTGIDKSGHVDSKKLMQMMAIQQNMTQAPNIHFVSHADQLVKQILTHPHLSNEDKIQFLTSAQDAYERQGRGDFVKEDSNTQPPPPTKTNYFTPRKSPKTFTTTSTDTSPPSFTTTPPGVVRKIQLIERKVAQIDQSRSLPKKQKQELKKKLQGQLRKLRSGKEY